MSVIVGVRVRPFNKRQKQLNCKCCVQMIGTTTHVHQLQTNDQKSFSFDYSFWSHDKFQIDDNGYYQPQDNKYADQKKVYNQIGSTILVNAWEGYNCCLFAYGQTGSGKSYSMLGYGSNKGIIPMVCDNIFQKITKDTDKTHSFEVKVSMMQIYNQTLRDLLTKQKKNKQLKIKQTKKLGVYVQGLVKTSVHSYQEIAQKIQQGSNNRSIAATLMNQSSSRSHTIVSITFLQKIQISFEQTSIKFSTIHLVDLAGSQSVGKTGVDSKDRLRQAAKINQSLSTLGRVIQILAENSGKGEKQKSFVPYRDSKLTFILRNALGGNSRTAMICAISPANDNYQQTVSTLRYASRAKKIQNKAIVNQSDVDKLIRTLRQQNQRLKQMLKQARMNKTQINLQTVSDVQQMNKNMAEMGIIADYQIQQDNISQISKEDKDNISFYQNNISILDYNQKIDQNLPYITNLNQDQLLSGKVKYSCSKQLTIGNKHGVPRPNVVLSALGILPQHCLIRNQQGKLYLQIVDQQASQYTFVNGKNNLMKNISVELMNYDRLIFGTQCVFLVKILNGQIRSLKKGTEQHQPQLDDIDYQFAISQQKQNYLTGGLFNNIKKIDKNEEEELRKKVIDEIQQEFVKMKIDNEEDNKKKLEQQQYKFRQKIDKIEKQRLQQVQKFKQQLSKQSQQASKLRTQKQTSESQLIHLKQIQKKLQQTNCVDKQALQKARRALEQKKQMINTLQCNIIKNNLQMKNKQIQMKFQLQKKQKVIQKQLELKIITCNNQNILNNYKLEQEKKIKKYTQLKQLLLNSEKIQMQNQLLQLLPMLERFNLMAKQLKKNIQCRIAINYNYISQSQYLAILEQKKKRKQQSNYFLIQILNRNQNRTYFWTISVFKYRYELVQSIFNQYCIDPNSYQEFAINQNDPYWDPPTPQIIGLVYLLLEPLFNLLQYDDKLTIVRKGKKIGQVRVKIYPTDNEGHKKNISIDTKSGIQLHNPRDFVQKNLSFEISITQLKLQEQQLYSQIQIQYEFLLKQSKRQTTQHPSDFTYQNHHTLSDLSQIDIENYINKPLCIKILGNIKQSCQQTIQILTERDYQSQYDEKSYKQSITQNDSTMYENHDEKYSTPISKKQQNNNHNSNSLPKNNIASKCGILVNQSVMDQIDKKYNQSKQKGRVQKKKKKKQDCYIF